MVKPKKRPEVLYGSTYRIVTGCGNFYVTVNRDEGGKIFEVFTQMGKAGGCAASQAEAIGRLVSTSLRADVDAEALVNQLKGIRCHSPKVTGGREVLSCSDAVAQALEMALAEAKEKL